MKYSAKKPSFDGVPKLEENYVFPSYLHTYKGKKTRLPGGSVQIYDCTNIKRVSKL